MFRPSILIGLLLFVTNHVAAFNLVMMAKGRRKGNLKKQLTDETSASRPAGLNGGKGQEITGVTLPADGKLKGWEFGKGRRMACANVDGRFYGLQGECPRCSFDLWKGDVLVDDPCFDDRMVLACPTCSTTYSLLTGKSGPPLRRTGLAAFVGNLANTATVSSSGKNAQAYIITRDQDGRVYCRER